MSEVSRRMVLKGALGAAAAWAVADRVSLSAASANVAASYRFASSGIVGGGFQNVIAVSPFNDVLGRRTYLLGADVAGIHRSVDGGKTWKPPSVPRPGVHVAALRWSSRVAGKCFALTNEGFYRTTDFGLTWVRQAGAVDADANGGYQTGEGEHPRPTGNLISQDASGAASYLWVGTATQGIKRTSNDGVSWEAVALAGEHIRSIAIDSVAPDVLYVAVRNTAAGNGTGTVGNNGVWRCTNARGAMTFTRMIDYPGSSRTPEEFTYVNDVGVSRLFVAGARDGVFEYSLGTWKNRSTGLDIGASGAVWLSIYGYRDAATGAVVLYAGATKCVLGRAIMKSTNGGASWSAVSTNSTGLTVTAHSTLYGSTATWWLANNAYQRFAGNKDWTAGHITGDSDNRGLILVAGRGGAWFGVQAPNRVDWYPADCGLMVTVNNSVDADPQVPAVMAVGNMDYQIVASADHGVSCVQRGTGAGSPITTGDMVFFDRDGTSGARSTIYVGVSQRGTQTDDGGVWSNPDIGGSGAWVSEGLPVNGDPVAVAVTRDSAGNKVILVSVQGSADGTRPNRLYRKVGATWQPPITGGPFAANSGFGSFAVSRGSRVVYAFDASGVWRSNTAGAQGSWTKIATASAGYQTLNNLVIDRIAPAVVYFSDGGAVKRVANADTSTGVTSSQISTILTGANAGPIAGDKNGGLFVHDRGGATARLLFAAAPRTGTVSFAAVQDVFYAENATSIRSLHVGDDGYVYTADNGNGVLVGQPG